MRIKAEMAVALRESRGAGELKKFGPDLPVSVQPIGFASGQPASEGAEIHIGPFVADKYALLLKYSDKARVAEARLSSLPDDLRERFRHEAVADPRRIEEFVAAAVAEGRKRLNPFGDPVLNALYRKLGLHGFEAQAEFLQVLELLKGQVDPEKVFARIIEDHPSREAEEKSRPSAHREAAPVPRRMETAEEIEKRRRRAEKIAREIVELRRAFEDRHLSEGPEVSKEGDWAAKQESPVRRRNRAVAVPTGSPVVAAPSAVSGDTSDEAEKTAAMTAVRQPRKSAVAAGSFAWQPSWTSVAGATLVLLAASGAAWKLTVPSAETGQMVHASPAVVAQQPAVLREATAHAAATEASVTETALKAAEEKLAADAARRRDEAARKRRQEQEQQQAAIEAARQMAEAQGRAAAHEAAQHELAEMAPEPVQAPPATVAADSTPKPAAGARQPEEAEAALNLSERDRKRVQTALTALGHEVPATGYFGPITRKMIAAWQKTQGLPETGFLDSAQLAALTTQAGDLRATR